MGDKMDNKSLLFIMSMTSTKFKGSNHLQWPHKSKLIAISMTSAEFKGSNHLESRFTNLVFDLISILGLIFLLFSKLYFNRVCIGPSLRRSSFWVQWSSNFESKFSFQKFLGYSPSLFSYLLSHCTWGGVSSIYIVCTCFCSLSFWDTNKKQPMQQKTSNMRNKLNQEKNMRIKQQ